MIALAHAKHAIMDLQGRREVNNNNHSMVLDGIEGFTYKPSARMSHVTPSEK
jgi:hypothetical protein